MSSRTVGAITILEPKGKLDISEEAIFRDAIQLALERGTKRILLDLKDVSYIDSAGLGALVRAFTSAANRGAVFKLLRPTRKISDILQITQLATVFEIYDQEAEAVASFEQPEVADS